MGAQGIETFSTIELELPSQSATSRVRKYKKNITKQVMYLSLPLGWYVWGYAFLKRTFGTICQAWSWKDEEGRTEHLESCYSLSSTLKTDNGSVRVAAGGHATSRSKGADSVSAFTRNKWLRLGKALPRRRMISALGACRFQSEMWVEWRHLGTWRPQTSSVDRNAVFQSGELACAPGNIFTSKEIKNFRLHLF